VDGNGAVLHLAEGTEAVPRARAFTRTTLTAWAAGELRDDVVLVVSELVTNGLLHAGLPITLRLTGDAGLVRIEVCDPSTVAPVRPLASTEAMTGRGIALVDAVSRRWGVDRLPDGKRVWCEVAAVGAEEEPTVDGELDVDALLAAWGDDAEGAGSITVELGDVPTDLLLAAKAHVDNLVREFALAAGGEASGSTAAVPEDLARLIHTVVHRFGDARQAIKRQALAAAERGEGRTRLRLTLTPAALEAGAEYLDALDQADAYARDARLLTLETPPQHRVFRQWYVEALVDQARRNAEGLAPTVPPTFEERLLGELGALAAAQRASARSARLQAVTSALAEAVTALDVARVVVAAATAVLGATDGRLLLDPRGGHRTGVRPGPAGSPAAGDRRGSAPRLVDATEGTELPPDDPAAAAVATGQPLWLETRHERDERFPGLSAREPLPVSLCAVPLQVLERTLGALRLTFDGPRLFDGDERAFLIALAGQTSSALERTALYEAERQARADAENVAQRLVRLQQVTAALAGASDEQSVADVFVTHAAEALGAAITTFSVLVDDDQLQVIGAQGLGQQTLERFARYPVAAQLPASEAVRTGRPVEVQDGAELERRFPELFGSTDASRSLVCVPVALPDRMLGVISLSFPDDHRFDDTQRRFLAALADTCAQALDRARALSTARQATDKLAFLAAASSELGGSLDYRQTLANVARLVVPRMADWCAIHVVEDGEYRVLAVAHVDPDKVAFAQEMQMRFPPRRDATQGATAVIRSGVSELYEHVTDEQLVAGAADEDHLRITRELGLSSVLIVPLTGRAGTFGAITMIYAESGRHYDPDDLAFAEDLARRAATAVENAQTFRQQTGQLAAMTRVADAAQQAILAPVPVRVGPLNLAAAYVSAARDALVGGDLYEVVEREGSVRLLIGDVRGKGLGAVRMATVVLGHFRSAAVECADLPSAARQIDQRLRAYLGDEDFVTALLAEVFDDGRCEVICCGHPPAMLARSGRLTPVGRADSLPLGLGADPAPVTVQLTPGARLLLYTDGILDARDSTGRFVKLAELLAPLENGPLPGALDALLDRLRTAIGGPLGDDLALLVAEYDPKPEA
jgi:GAF domain-containing protein